MSHKPVDNEATDGKTDATEAEADVPSTGTLEPQRLYLSCDIEGHDIDCGNKDYTGNKVPYCQLNNGLPAAVKACSRNKDCKAVVTDNYNFYLKSKSAPCQYREGWMVVALDK
ncbi:hypothetical protein FOA52_010805 [Chlamydomonas sp. UWO 241]|nr:hypothetical protein FOA52_010805 [Chlamydomonas sp. UWO 241]